MSMREQERRKRRAKRRADSVKQEIARKRRNTELLAKEAKRRADQVKRWITVGDVEPRPLPSVREDSLPSIESMESAALTGGVPSEEEAYSGGDMGEDVSLGTDPKGAHEEPG